MAFVASVAFPVLPGKADRVKNFEQELAPHRAEWDRLCREAGDYRFYNITLQGDLAIHSLVVADPAKARSKFSDTPYDRWWVAFVKDVHGVDFDAPDAPGLPPSVFTWQA